MMQEGRVEIIEAKYIQDPNGKIAVGKLIVKNVNKQKDAGHYKCKVSDSANNHNSKVINVRRILSKLN